MNGVIDTEGTALTRSGMIVGRYFTPDGNTHGFTLINGRFQSIDAPGAIDPRAIVGTYYSADNVYHGSLCLNGVFSTIDFPNSVFT